MQQSLANFGRLGLHYTVGNVKILEQMQTVPVKVPFSVETEDFLDIVSKTLLSDRDARGYPDVMTFAFWLRKASMEGMRKRLTEKNDGLVRLGRGLVFHIAPSNVPVNYAYSLAAGLICGNRNVVRIPSKDFEQVRIINQALEAALDRQPEMAPYLCLVQYGHDSIVNDVLSSVADMRIIWGGDNTINELRKSPLKPRASEITFADRYSFTVIDSDAYMALADRKKTVNDFYNDTYLTDQNACTSPRVVVWTGGSIEKAKEVFWKELHDFLKGKYEISGVQAVNKLASSYLSAVMKDGVERMPSEDNLITRVHVPRLTPDLMELKDNSGYFFEYDCSDIMELREFCNDTGCQTLSYIGNVEELKQLVLTGTAGIDRIVPVGKTMDFDFIWDGYNLFERMTRVTAIR